MKDEHYIKSMAKLIREKRYEFNMTQTELGIELGVSFQQVQKYETGVNQISASMIPRLCVLFKITPNDFLGWNELPLLTPLPTVTAEELLKLVK